MKTIKVIIAAILMVTLTLSAANAEEWKNLFNGKDLQNFTKRGGTAPYHIDGKDIVGATVPGKEVNGKMQGGTANTFLCTNQHYSDFILEYEFKVDPSMNSGVQIRSNSFKDYQNYRVHGYQIEIDPSDRAWTAGIYDEARRGWLNDLKENPKAQKAFKQNEWNKVRVEAIGDSIKTFLNGVPAADLKDGMTASGFIALQVHGTKEVEPMEVRWRNLRIKDLSEHEGSAHK